MKDHIWAMGITEEKIKRINELAHKAKSKEGLTEAELKERHELRQEYLASFRNNLEDQIKNIRILESDGTVTKVEKKKSEMKLN